MIFYGLLQRQGSSKVGLPTMGAKALTVYLLAGFWDTYRTKTGWSVIQREEKPGLFCALMEEIGADTV